LITRWDTNPAESPKKDLVALIVEDTAATTNV